MNSLTIGEKTVSVFPSAQTGAPILYLNTFSGEGRKVYETVQAVGCPSFSLVAIGDLDWNRDMILWDSPPAFRNADACTGSEDAYLKLLTEAILPSAERQFPGNPRWRSIAGYSLAGLFVLCAIYQTDLFSCVGSIPSRVGSPK